MAAQFVFWNRDFKRLVREIRPLDFPETATVGFALEISFQRHQLCKDPTVGLSGMFNSNLKKNSARINYIYIYIIKLNRITTLQFVFWNCNFKRLVREIRPSDFPETETLDSFWKDLSNDIKFVKIQRLDFKICVKQI